MKALEGSTRSIEIQGLEWGANKAVPIGNSIRELTRWYVSYSVN